MIDRNQTRSLENVPVFSFATAGVLERRFLVGEILRAVRPDASQSSALHSHLTSLRFLFLIACFQHPNALLDVRQPDRKSETLVLAALDG